MRKHREAMKQSTTTLVYISKPKASSVHTREEKQHWPASEEGRGTSVRPQRVADRDAQGPGLTSEGECGRRCRQPWMILCWVLLGDWKVSPE